ncbi:hypothetical protein Tco_1090142 [Tanacetum coccineum]|uniref:Uncharacterized protein n=1 Tax=Tanacetum coccineum TaxID=301880 RepID=A0ABQ5I4B4_9ASTR
MSTPVFIDPDISTQSDGAQSSRVPVPLSEDPYEAIRHAYLVGTDTESEPFEGEAEAPKSPHTESEDSDTSDARSTTTYMAVRAPPTMSSGLSASVAEVAVMSDSTFRKRFRSSYNSLPSSSPPDLPSQKRYRDSDSVSADAEEEGPTTEDEDPAIGDEGLAAGDEPRPVVETDMGEPLGLGYGALRRREIALGEGQMLSVFEVGQSSGSVPESERPEIVSALRQLTLTT